MYDFVVAQAQNSEPLGKTLRTILEKNGVALPPKPVRSLAAERRREIYREAILSLLQEREGEARMSEEKDRLYAKVASQLSRTERTGTKSNRPVWWYEAEYERYEMVKAGLIDGTAIRGIWKLTPKGARLAKTLKESQ